jgi:AAA ATPase domain/AAA domain, putative AbiEii toxin, Type IV TA system
MSAKNQASVLDLPVLPVENCGYLMITKISIKNFRCFKKLELSGLKRINVIVGRNSSGKSTLLESLFLSSGSVAARSAFQMRAIRKIGGNVVLPGEVSTYRGLWEDLFYNFDSDLRISIGITGSDGDGRSLGITYSEAGDQTLPFDKDLRADRSVGQISGGMPQIVFSWKRGSGPQIVVKPQFTEKGLTLGDSRIDFFQMIWYTTSDLPEEGAKRFSELSKENKSKPVVDALRNEFPFIEDIAIEYFSGVPMLFASVSGTPKRMPLGLVSEGVSRLFSILMGIASFKDGAILIDQIEDGFYHDRLESIWATIYRLAKDNNVQIFATTHSNECLDALSPTMQGHEDDFTLLRLDRNEEGGAIIHQVEGPFLKAAIDRGSDLR